MTTKRCFKCECEKSLESFYKHKYMADGHLNKCKECTKADVGKHRQANLERIRQYDRLRASMPHRMALRKRVVAQWEKDNPIKKLASTKVARAIKKGTLKRQPCWVCGRNAVAHHPDYDRPLDVVWLCQAHHKQAHAVAN